MSKNSILEIYDTKTGERTAVKEFDRIIEAPNWLNDGDTILYNSEGRIWRYSLSHDREEAVDTGACTDCNNDHVPSPDNQWLAISNNTSDGEEWGAHIYVLPMEGGEPRQVTEISPSYLHGWSADNELAYCAFRGGSDPLKSDIDVYTISAEGGEERRITDGKGYNDGPEFSPDGKHIWFNSTRTGQMQVFRVDRDGGNLTQMTDSEDNNWFGHVSPDGKKVVYLTFRRGDLEPWQHLPDKNVEIWMMNYDGSGKEKLMDVFGGQGTINVNSWAPDSRRFAFVSYR